MKEKYLILFKNNRDHIFSLGSSLIRSGSRFLLIILASKFLSPDSFGIFNIFIAIYFFSRILSDGSLQMPYVKLASEKGSEIDMINIHVAVLKLIYIFAVSAVLLAGGDYLIEFTGLREKKLLYIMPFLLLSFGFYSFICQFLNAKLRMGDLFVLETVQCFIMILLLARCYFYSQLDQLDQYLWIFIISFTLSGGIGIILYGRDITLRRKFSKELLGKILYYSKYSVIIAMGAMLFLKADVIMLGHFRSTSEVAVYGIALIVSEIINVILDAIQKVCLPSASFLSSQGKNSEVIVLFRKSMRNAYLLSLPAVLSIILVSPFALKYLYGGGYDGALIVIVLLGISSLMKPAGYIAGTILLASGYARVDNLNCWLTAIMNIVLNLFFIPLWGIMGAAMATIISYCMLSILQYRAFNKLLVIPSKK